MLSCGRTFANDSMTILDALIVAAFLVYVVVVGLRDRREASGGPEQYFLAGRSLSGWQAGGRRKR